MALLCVNMAFTLRGWLKTECQYGSNYAMEAAFVSCSGFLRGENRHPGMPVLGEARALAQDHLVTARADGDHGHRHAQQGFDAQHIVPGSLGQLGEGAAGAMSSLQLSIFS